MEYTAVQKDRPTYPRPISTIIVLQIFKFVNNKDLLRYIPDDMLSPSQKKTKWRAIAETIEYTNNKNDEKYFEFVSEGNLQAARQMVAETGLDSRDCGRLVARGHNSPPDCCSVPLVLQVLNKKITADQSRLLFTGCGERTRTSGLRVMSPTSYQLLYSAISVC